MYRSEINEEARTLKLWLRRKSGKLVCSVCGGAVSKIAEVYEREVRDLPCFEYRTTVVVELYRVRCPNCGVKAEKILQLPSKAPFSKRFEDTVGESCESATARRATVAPSAAFFAGWRSGADDDSSATSAGALQ